MIGVKSSLRAPNKQHITQHSQDPRASDGRPRTANGAKTPHHNAPGSEGV